MLLPRFLQKWRCYALAHADIDMQAVERAIEQKVDVISISWITKDAKELKKAIEKAVKESDDPNDRPILVFCSTADEGVCSGNVYRACYDGTVSVSDATYCNRLRNCCATLQLQQFKIIAPDGIGIVQPFVQLPSAKPICKIVP